MKIRKYYGAGIILYHREGNVISVLLEKRSDNGSWAIPGGGYSTRDGDLKATAVRELREETGIAITSDNVQLVKEYSLPFFRYAVFASECQEKHKAMLNWESADASWFDIRELPAASNWITKIELDDFRRRIR